MNMLPRLHLHYSLVVMEICIVDMAQGKHLVNRGAGSNTGTGSVRGRMKNDKEISLLKLPVKKSKVGIFLEILAITSRVLHALKMPNLRICQKKKRKGKECKNIVFFVESSIAQTHVKVGQISICFSNLQVEWE